MVKASVNGIYAEAHHTFYSEEFKIFQGTDLDGILRRMKEVILERFVMLEQAVSSGWTLVGIDEMKIHFADYHPLNGSSYVELSEFIRSKKAVINILNKDDQECFRYAVTIATLNLMDRKNADCVTKKLKRQSEIFNWTGVNVPATFEDVDVFEKNNCVSIKILGLDSETEEFTVWTSKVKLNKPSYLGVAILELSKKHMYDFHYNYVQEKWGSRAEILFTDTDSLVYEIQTEDFYKDISPDVNERFDTSNYRKDHPSGIPTGKNKKVIGMFNDEGEGKEIFEFAGLRAKCYALKFNDKEEKRCKGVKTNVVEKYITFQDYKDCVFTKVCKIVTQNVFRSRQHTVFTEKVQKIGLSAEDDKIVVLEDEIRTLPLTNDKNIGER